MFKNLVEKLLKNTSPEAERTPDMREISAQLLIEVARSDTDISEPEREKILQSIAKKSRLDSVGLAELLKTAEAQVDSSTSFHQHVKSVNEHFSKEQKIMLIEQMWQVAFADGKLDHYEEAFIRQIADLIHVKHRNFMQAKLRVVNSDNPVS